MNGDLGKIYEKLETMDEKQDKRHEENLKTFGALPCAVHFEKLKALGEKVNFSYWILGAVTIGGVVLGVWVKVLMAN